MTDHDPTLLGREFTAAVVLFHEAVGRALGLGAADRKCLDVLDRLGPVTAGAISDHTGLTTGAVTGMIDRLHRAGHVERRPNPHDRRSVLVALRTGTARDAVLPTIFGPLGEDMAELAGRFSPHELAAIDTWLRATTDILRRHTRAIADRAGAQRSVAERSVAERPDDQPAAAVDRRRRARST